MQPPLSQRSCPGFFPLPPSGGGKRRVKTAKLGERYGGGTGKTLTPRRTAAGKKKGQLALTFSYPPNDPSFANPLTHNRVWGAREARGKIKPGTQWGEGKKASPSSDNRALVNNLRLLTEGWGFPRYPSGESP